MIVTDEAVQVVTPMLLVSEMGQRRAVEEHQRSAEWMTVLWWRSSSHPRRRRTGSRAGCCPSRSEIVEQVAWMVTLFIDWLGSVSSTPRMLIPPGACGTHDVVREGHTLNTDQGRCLS